MKVCSSCQRCYDDVVVSCSESEHPELSELRGGSTNSVPGYRLHVLLGSGIKVDTFRARRIDSDQPVVLKIVSTSEEYKEKFLRDAQTSTTLFDQRLCDVYEAGSLDGDDVFVVMEEPNSQTVRELLNNVGVPQLLTTIQVVRQAAEAVHTLHLNGLIHRSVRPENILLTTDAEHRMLVRIQDPDLGGAVEHAIVSNKFLIDSALDSLRYFAPEQFSGGTTIKSDVYGLGIVLYEMLAGTPPFDADKASGLIDLHRNQRPPDVAIDNFDLRMLLTHTLMESLQKDPAKRQSSANAFARQLRHMEQLAMHSPTPPPASVAPTPPPANVARPVPSAANGASAPAATAARLAPIVQTSQPVVVKETPPASAPIVVNAKPEMMADRPIPRPDAELEPVIEPAHPISNAIVAVPDPIIVVELKQTGELQGIESEQPIATKKVDTIPTKSRLKRMKKQLRTFTAPAALAESTGPAVPLGIEVDHEEPSEIPTSAAENDLLPIEHAVDPGFQPVDLSIGPALAATTVAAPQQIEWQPSEEDIPSLGDIPEAFFNEPMPTASIVAKSPVLAEPVPAASSETISDVPRKVEWEQPDDLPSMENIVRVLPEEAVVPEVAQPAIEAVVVTPLVVPRKIEWVQPEDDIPSMEDTFGFHSVEPITETASVAPVVESTAPAASLGTPRKIEWVQPEDDIPSMEDVFESLAKEPIAEAAFVAAVHHEAASIKAPRKIEWVQPEDDIPRLEEAMGAVDLPVPPEFIEPEIVPVADPYNNGSAARVNIVTIPDPPPNEVQVSELVRDLRPEPTAASAQVMSVAEPEHVNVRSVSATASIEPEEITVVTPRRVMVDVEQPVEWAPAAARLSNEMEFFPTLLDDPERHKIPDGDEHFFSDYDDTTSRLSEHYRSLMIGGGFIVLIVLFLLGNESVWKLFQTGNMAEPVAVQAPAAPQNLPRQQQMITPDEQDSLETFEKPRSVDVAENGRTIPAPIKVNTATPEVTTKLPADTPAGPTNDRKVKNHARGGAKTPLVPSTLVISSDDGRISSKLEPQKRNNSPELTRPRVVRNPNP